MKTFNWAERFEEERTCKDIPGRVRRTEVWYWASIALTVLITLVGIHMLLISTETRAMLIGLFVALAGMTNIALVKLWAHLRIVMYYLIWDSQNRLEAELNKSLAEDL